MKALEKDRTRRYETANGLAADILRHLAHEPVVAAPPSGIYRLRKFIRKHRGAVIAASLVVVSLLGGLGSVAAVQTVANSRLEASLQRETDAKNEAIEAKDKLNIANSDLVRSRAAVQTRYELAEDAIKTFHTGVSEDFLLKEDKFKNLRNTLLKSASDFYGRLGALLGKETDFASRRALAQSNFELAELTGKVGDNEAALAAHRAVLAAREPLAAEPASGSAIQVDVVANSLGAVAETLELMGKTDEVIAAYRRKESFLAALPTSDPSVRAALAKCRSLLGTFMFRTGRRAEALAAWRLARPDQEALAAGPEASNQARSDLASTLQSMGGMLAASGKPTEAEADLRTALAIREKLVHDNPAVTQFHLALASIHNSLGVFFDSTARWPEQEAEFRAAMEIQQKLADDNPAVTQFRRSVAISHNNLSELLFRMGKLSEAEVEVREALRIREKLVHDNPAAIQYLHGLGLSHASLGQVLRDTARLAEAEAEYRIALAHLQRVVEAKPAFTESRFGLGSFSSRLAELLEATGRPSEAEAGYRTALATAQKIVDANPTNTTYGENLASAQSDLGRILARGKRFPEAFTALDTSLAIRQKQLDAEPKNAVFSEGLGRTYAQRGKVRVLAGQPSLAAADLRRAHELWAKMPRTKPAVRFEQACVLALLNGLGQDPKSGVIAAEAAAYADQAVAALLDAGRATWARREELQAPDFESLRKRDDFQKLLAELEAKHGPEAKEKD